MRPDLPEPLNQWGKPIIGEPQGLMGNRPHRLKRSRVLLLPWNQMPMDMGQLVTEQFIIHLYGLPFHGKTTGYHGDFFNQVTAVGAREVEEFCNMLFQDQHGPAGKVLVVMEIGSSETAVGYEMVLARPRADTSLAGRAGHG